MTDTKLSPEEKKLMEASFERYDRLKEFEGRLRELINSMGIDSLLETPDYILAMSAKNQMEFTSAIWECHK